MDIRVVPYDHPDAEVMIEALQGEYLKRYGGRDRTEVHPSQFAPPLGLFLVGYGDDRPLTCGGWRVHAEGVVEIKRMYVVPEARGRGLARAMLAELELTAKRAGHRQIILETGGKQPEAIGLYLSSGFTPVAKFGRYAYKADAMHLGKTLA